MPIAYPAGNLDTDGISFVSVSYTAGAGSSHRGMDSDNWILFQCQKNPR